MSNIQQMSVGQLTGYRAYLEAGLSLDLNSPLDGENFADVIELHDYCRERLVAVITELDNRMMICL